MMCSTAKRLSQLTSAAAFLTLLAPAAIAGPLEASRGQTLQLAQASGESSVGEPIRLIPNNQDEDAGAQDGGAGEGAQAGDEPRAPSGIEVDSLSAPGLGGIGLLSPATGGFGRDLWIGSSRRQVLALMERLPSRISSPAANDLARRLLLSAAEPPSEVSAKLGATTISSLGTSRSSNASTGAVGDDLLVARARHLVQLGHLPALGELLQAVPERGDDEPLARYRAQAGLVAGNYEDACRQVRNGIQRYSKRVFWEKAMVFCHLRAGANEKAQFLVSILAESGGEDAASFVRLARAVMAGIRPLPDLSTAAPTDLVMLDLLDARLEDAPAWPDGARAALVGSRLEALPLTLRVSLAEQAANSGLIEGSRLAELYQAIPFTAEQRDNALTLADTMPPPRDRALLHQAAREAGLAAVLTEILAAALERGRQAGLFHATIVAKETLLAGIEPVADLAWFAGSAGRALYALGRYEQASAWLNLSRRDAMINPQAQASVTALWPYARLAGARASDWDGSLAAWVEARQYETEEALTSMQTLLLVSLRAFDEAVPLEWADLAAKGVSSDAERPLPSAAVILALRQASDSGRLGESLLLALIALGEDGPVDMHPLALDSVLSALVRLGLTGEARRLAIEAAIAEGV